MSREAGAGGLWHPCGLRRGRRPRDPPVAPAPRACRRTGFTPAVAALAALADTAPRRVRAPGPPRTPRSPSPRRRRPCRPAPAGPGPAGGRSRCLPGRGGPGSRTGLSRVPPHRLYARHTALAALVCAAPRRVRGGRPACGRSRCMPGRGRRVLAPAARPGSAEDRRWPPRSPLRRRPDRLARWCRRAVGEGGQGNAQVCGSAAPAIRGCLAGASAAGKRLRPGSGLAAQSSAKAGRIQTRRFW